jgi:hypothetical protein
MAERSGAGGAIGWLLLGFLGGIAVTLGVETLMYGHSHRAVAEDPAVATPPRMSVALPTPITPVKAPHEATKAAPDPSRAYQAPQPEGQVEDDAAAAGMTTRSTHSQDASEPR